MAAQKGKEILIKVSMDAGATYVTIGGLRTKSISLNKETVDVTDSDSVGQWRELIAGAGVKTCSISGSGVFKDSTSEGYIRQCWANDVTPLLQFIVPNFQQIAGTFDIPTIEYSGEYNGEAQFSMTFESAGPLTFTAI